MLSAVIGLAVALVITLVVLSGLALRARRQRAREPSRARRSARRPLRRRRLARDLLPCPAGALQRRRPPPARRARRARRSRARERAALPGGPPARGPRRADRSSQPPLLPRDARA